MLDEYNIFFEIGSFILSVSLGLIILPNILIISHKKKLYDVPDERKVHDIPVPRLGGVSFFPIIIMTWCLATAICYMLGFNAGLVNSRTLVIEICLALLGLFLLYLVGIEDDLIGVGYRYKFLCQIIAGVCLVAGGQWLNSLGGLFGVYQIPAYIGMPLTVFLVVYITNAINLIDGIDGLASGLSSLALGVLAIVYHLKGEFRFEILALASLGIVMTFWCFNVFGNAKKGNKLFMGDSGSLTLGFILSLLVIHLARVYPEDGLEAEDEFVLAFSTLTVPLFDVVRLVFHRIKFHKNPFLPDMNHIHHRLLRTGLRFHQVMYIIIAMAIFFILFDLLMLRVVDINVILMLDVAIWTLFHYIISQFIKVHEAKIASEGADALQTAEDKIVQKAEIAAKAEKERK